MSALAFVAPGACCYRRSHVAPATAKLHAPRQGPQTRVCIVTRERLPRNLLFRVVRQSEPGSGKRESSSVATPGGNARSAPDGQLQQKRKATKEKEKQKGRRGRHNKHQAAAVALHGHGRSAYVRKDVDCVEAATRKKRLSRALRCDVPKDVENELLRLAHEWQRVPTWRRGLTYAECFGTDGMGAAVDEVQDGCVGGMLLCGTMYDDDDDDEVGDV